MFTKKKVNTIPKLLVQSLKKVCYTNTPTKVADRLLVEGIKQKTDAANTNNLTRTKAYLTFYNHNPDIHWSFLAHMVSRNTGWNMTDLKGSLLPNLLSFEECQAFYSFLECGNWLIFRDAFPQLLLYEESKKQNRSLFYLLDHFQISAFMKAVWEFNFNNRNHSLLTTALIINEQNHLEIHAMKNPHFQSVFSNPAFALQDLLSLTQIIFPYCSEERVHLSGITIHRMASLSERISIGKSLYSLLFGSKEHTQKVMEWAQASEHTGSRKDFWPNLFNTVKEETPGLPYVSRLSNCTLRKSATRFYSPLLTNAWKNQVHFEPRPIDWYKYPYMIEHLSGKPESINHNVEEEYCSAMKKIELAIAGKKIISSF